LHLIKNKSNNKLKGWKKMFVLILFSIWISV
jgi:hypothetical protein